MEQNRKLGKNLGKIVLEKMTASQKSDFSRIASAVINDKPFIVVTSDDLIFSVVYELLRRVKIGLGLWNEADEDAYKKAMNGK